MHPIHNPRYWLLVLSNFPRLSLPSTVTAQTFFFVPLFLRTSTLRQKPHFRGIFTAPWLLGLCTSFLRHIVAEFLFYCLNEAAAPTETPPAISEITAWALACAFSFCCRVAPRRQLGRPEPPTVPRAASPTPRWPLLGPYDALLSTARSPNMHVQYVSKHSLILKYMAHMYVG